MIYSVASFLLGTITNVTRWKQALVIIQPDTLVRWHREEFRLFWKHKSKPKSAKAKISAETIELIKQMARENLPWSAEPIRGELLKLGTQVAKRTIQKYMRGVRPSEVPSQNWSTFVKNHAQDFWAGDFLPVVDLFFRQAFIFFIIELGSRRVLHFGVTRQPTKAWVAQQLREATPDGVGPRYLIRDNDGKFGTRLDWVAKRTRIEVLKIPYRTRGANAICERFLGTVRQECLDHLLICGERKLYRVIREYVAYFNRARLHQGIGQRTSEGSRFEGTAPSKGEILGFPILNGLHHDYRRAA